MFLNESGWLEACPAKRFERDSLKYSHSAKSFPLACVLRNNIADLPQVFVLSDQRGLFFRSSLQVAG
ncbi:MAG: hypothetical protein WKF77_15275 [Planctomycetaceae bacterium]